MSNCKTVGQNQKVGRERVKSKEFACYLDWCVWGSWWVGEELPRAEGALRQHEEGEVGAKICGIHFCPIFLGSTTLPSLLLGSLQKF